MTDQSHYYPINMMEEMTFQTRARFCTAVWRTETSSPSVRPHATDDASRADVATRITHPVNGSPAAGLQTPSLYKPL